MTFDEVLAQVLELLQREQRSRTGPSSDALPWTTSTSKT